MKVIRAGVLGFCMGVRRAVDLAGDEAARAAPGRVTTLGPLIHNPQAMEALKTRGITAVDEQDMPQDLTGAAVIIRAHGVSPQVEAEVCRRGGRVVDATCPKVKASQLKAKALVQAGYRLFLAGAAYHAEIIGILGYAAAGLAERGEAAAPCCAVAGNTAEAAAAAARLKAAAPGAKTALLGQTTIAADEYRAIGETIQAYFPDLEIVQTICSATTDRQESLRKLLASVDAVIVAGGAESANTRALLAIAEKSGKPCALAETAADIPADFAAFRTIGLCAGASTPDFAIDAIERALAAL